ncbi:MAG: undecaprenyl/decaprenyl-phosphate alpha-N-acetylglucosaminyl 1-phosphate transferase [Clostridia bacterium]|nr:undecaprenyl/decaprenyl-phosphate alpha-N-acetylglucosaminyl 1-phosphate transferase [Clostridia bacterium]
MQAIESAAFAALLGCGAALALTPTAIALSLRIGAVDVPRDFRRMHKRPVPRGGGIAILLAFLLTAAFFGERGRAFSALLIGGGAMLLLGLSDDLLTLGAWSKLLLQSGITFAALLLDGRFQGVFLLLAMLWVLTLINAHNFIDGLDGLFAGSAAIEGGALALLLLWQGKGMGVLCLGLAGACLGFRFFNRHPARVFAGDAGSESVGFLLGFLSLEPLFGGGFDFSALAVLLLFGYPLTDLFTAILRRILRGKSPFCADRGHLHHRISAIGLDQRRCTDVLLSLSAMLGICALFVGISPLRPLASAACLAGAFGISLVKAYVLRKASFFEKIR